MLYTLVRRDLLGNINAVFSFDSITSFDESWSATVTTQTVEKGFNISDNINIEPPTYSIDAVLSGYSLFNKDNEIVWDGESFKSSDLKDNSRRHIEARDNLLQIFTERSILTLMESSANANPDSLDVVQMEQDLRVGYYKEIPNCVITSISISQPSGGYDAFFVSIKLQKVFVAVVTYEEVTGARMLPVLTGLKAKSKNVASTATKAGDTDPESVAATPDESGIEEKKDETLGGQSWDEGYADHQRKSKNIQQELKYIEDTYAYATSTNSTCKLETINGVLSRKCTSGN